MERILPKIGRSCQALSWILPLHQAIPVYPFFVSTIELIAIVGIDSNPQCLIREFRPLHDLLHPVHSHIPVHFSVSSLLPLSGIP